MIVKIVKNQKMKRILSGLILLFTLAGVINAQDEEKILVYKFDIKKVIAAPIWRTTKISLEEAKNAGADYVLIHMNTYGGQVDMADSIRTAILNFPLPVMVFIDNQAISAGALISIACDSIYMRPGGNIGAATVVNQSGEQVPDKYQSFMRGMMRSTSEAHGKIPVVENGDTTWIWHRDPAIAQSMVDPKVYVEGVSDTGSVLTLTTLEAINLGFCEGEANSIEEVLRLAGIENYDIKEFKPGAVEKIIQLFLNPIVSGLLIMIVIGGIYFELQSPGIGFPLIAAIFAAILYFAPLYLEGIAANWQVLVFVAGIVLVAIEIFAIPGFGIAGVLGIAGIIAGLTFGMIDKINFRFGPSPLAGNTVIAAFAIVFISMLTAFILSIWGSKKMLTSNRLLGRFALQKIQETDKGYVSVDVGKQKSVVGMTGIAYTVLRPSGKVMINNEIYDAKSEVSYIEKGMRIIVKREESGQLYVLKSD